MVEKGNIPWNKGRTGVYTNETKQKMREAKIDKPSQMLGKHHSVESKLKIGLAQIGNTYRRGRKQTDETKLKISLNHADYRGNKNPAWRGGRCIDDGGYILISNREHPYSNTRGYVREHRLVMEKFLGRYLEPAEVIHHINGIRDDNRIENLAIENKNSHSKWTFIKVAQQRILELEQQLSGISS